MNAPLEEFEIRSALCGRLEVEIASSPTARIIEELGLCQGTARVDVAVVDAVLSGYEIKSDRDSLVRLAGQRAVYNRTLGQVTMVCTHRHLSAIRRRVPLWWGILVAERCEVTDARIGAPNHGIVFREIRRPTTNMNVSARAVAELLWRPEVCRILDKHDALTGIRSASRDVLWDRLASVLDRDELQREVREQLKVRTNWRADVWSA